ncbi:MAG: hypothetical protein R2722_01985 [Tessaracoccus sp.]
MPKNGQAVTEVMIRLVNMFSDGLVAIAFVFASLLLIAIALLNVRFVIRGTLEDDIHEIGAMKAIDIPSRTIARLYLLRYGAMTLFACIDRGTARRDRGACSHQRNRGQFRRSAAERRILLCSGGRSARRVRPGDGDLRAVLRAIGKMNMIAALVRRPDMARKTTRTEAGAPALAGARECVGRRLAVLELRAEARQWALLPAVFFPDGHLDHVADEPAEHFREPSFRHLHGRSRVRRVRADIQFASDDEPSVDVVHGELVAALRTTQVDSVQAYARARHLRDARAKMTEALRIEVGDYSGTTLVFIGSERPAAGQIALSMLNADKYQVGPGGRSHVVGGPGTVTVGSIYQET